MTITTAALLLYLAVTVAHAAERDCRRISCPCGRTGENVTVCAPEPSVREEVCTRFLKCESCEGRLNVCSTCPEGLQGPYCSQEKSQSRQKRQARYPVRYRPRPRTASLHSCPNLDSPKLGSLRCMASSDLQTCTGKCLPGYHFPSGNEDEMTLTCRRGQWTPRSSFPDCKSAGHCDLVVQGAGSFNCTTGMDGTRCDVRCSGMYPVRVFCYPGREWEPALPRCVKPKTNTEGRTACSCRNGATCYDSGGCACPAQWTGINCETAVQPRRSCPDPGFPTNGYRRSLDYSDAQTRRSFRPGEALMFGCDSDTSNKDTFTVTRCQEDGTWSHPLPTCLKTTTVSPSTLVCPDPGQKANAKRFNMDGTPSVSVFRNGRPEYPVGHSVVYTCRPGFYLYGQDVITCLASGKWSARTPYCRRLTLPSPLTTMASAPDPLVCPDPGQTPHASRLNTDGTPSVHEHAQPMQQSNHPAYAVGHSVVYTCHSGFALEGQSLITCLASGRWSARRPSCRRVPPSSPVTNETRPPSTSQRFCRDPKVDLNGIREPKTPPDRRGFLPGSRLDYSCESSYDLVGERTLFCLIEGKWSANRPRCVLKSTTTTASPLVYCMYPGDTDNGRVVYVPSLNERRRPADEIQEQYPEGSRLRYSCDSGYILEGSATLTCVNSGTWSAVLPRCVPDIVDEVYCLNPGPIPNGQVVYYPNINNRRRPTPQPAELDDPEYPVGGRLQYSCKSGFSLVGSAILICEESGVWSSDVPVCWRDTTFCKHPGKVDNARVMHIPPPNEKSRPTDDTNEEYPLESQLQYSCDYGYTLRGPDVLYCQSTGTWTASPPTCINDNPLSCENPGFLMNGRVQYCPPPINVRIRPEPSPDYDLDEFPERSVLEYSCDDGYRLQGNETLTCLPSGRWSSKIPTCESDCGRSYMQITAKVRNGNRTISGEWPWVVSISADAGGASSFICGGALLNPHTVITAAHCLVGYRSFILRFGKHHFKVEDDDEEVLQRRSSRVIIHPDYSNVTLDSDIGLIIFRPRIRYSLRLQPICLPNTQTTLRNLVPGRIGYVGGWGETENAVPPDIMMLASLPVVTNKQCMDAYVEQGLVITTNMFCAGYDDARQSVCGGDSGSPFVFYNKRTDRYVLEGLVSFGVRGQCGVAGKYAIFTEVFRFVRWIINNSKN